MKLQIVSDLHLDFHADCGKSLVDTIYTDKADVLIIAGDLSEFKTLDRSLNVVTDTYKKQEIIYVSGNHDYYFGSPQKVHSLLKNFEKEHKNFHFLNNSFYKKDDIEIVGATLWFGHTSAEEIYKDNMADFHVISDFDPWVFNEHYCTVEYLKLAINPNTIVVTHHIPTYLSVGDRYKNSFLNRFFVTDQSNLILDKSPKLWIHGHTHDPFDYVFGNTQIICNPFGYPSENTQFQEALIVDV